MPKLVVPSAALVTVRYGAGPLQVVNVYGASVQGTTTINQALANTLDAAIKASYTTTLGVHNSTNWFLASVAVRDIRTADQAEFVGTGAAVLGSAAGDLLPTGNSICITLRTAKAGQSFRGRSYLGGFTEAANDAAGSIVAAASTAAVNFVTAIGSAMSGNGLVLAVVSRPAERQTIVTTTFHADGTSDVDTKVRNARAGQVTPVTSITARNAVWDSQRRRTGAGSGSSLFGAAVATNFVGSE